MSTGGWSPYIDISNSGAEEACLIAFQVKADIEAQLKTKFAFYKPYSYRTQVVNGVNWLLSVTTGAALGAWFQAIIYQSLDGKVVKVSEVSVDKPIPVHEGGSGGYTTLHTIPQDGAFHAIALAYQFRPDMESKLKTTFRNFVPAMYATQVVNGVNWQLIINTQIPEQPITSGWIDATVYETTNGKASFVDVVPIPGPPNSRMVANANPMGPVGNWSPEIEIKDAQSEPNVAVSLAFQMKKKVEEKLNHYFDYYQPRTYRTQVVSGINYLIHVDTGLGLGGWFEAIIYRKLDGHVELTEVSVDKPIAAPEGGIGGWSKVNGIPLSREQQAIGVAFEAKILIETKLSTFYGTYIPRNYSYQVVNGTNYLINVKTGDLLGAWFEALLHRSLDGRVTLTKVAVDGPIFPHFAAAAALSSNANVDNISGGWTPFKDFGTGGVEGAVSVLFQMKCAILAKLHKKSFPMFNPLTYRTQIFPQALLGTNYLFNVIVSAAGLGFVDTIIHEAQDGTLSLKDAKEGIHIHVQSSPIAPWSEVHAIPQDGEPAILDIAFQVKGAIETRLNVKYDTYKPLSYSTQVVKGMNYRIVSKAIPHIVWPHGGGIGPVIPTYVEAWVYRSLDGQISLTKAEALFNPPTK